MMTKRLNISGGKMRMVLCVSFSFLLCIGVFAANVLGNTCFCGDECDHCGMPGMRASEASDVDHADACCSGEKAVSAEDGECRSGDMSDLSMVTVRIGGFDKTPAVGFTDEGWFLNGLQKHFPIEEDFPYIARSSRLYIRLLTFRC